MTTGLGYGVIAGIGKETNYGLGVPVTNKIPMLSESIVDEYKQNRSEALIGKAGLSVQDIISLSVGGNISAELCYDKKISASSFLGTDMLIAAAMGTNTYTATSNLLFTLKEDLSVFFTIAIARRAEDAGVVEVVSAMCKSMEISGSAGSACKISTDWIGFDVVRASQANDYDAQMLVVGAGEIPMRCLFADMTFRIEAHAANGSALAAGDSIPISSFSLKYDNKLTDTTNTTTDNSTYFHALKSIQPVRSGWREATLEITMPRHSADTFTAGAEAGTPFQADFTFSRDASNKLYIYFPYLLAEKAESPVGGADVLTEKVNFRCLRGAAFLSGTGNTDMLTVATYAGSRLVAEEFAIEVKNERTATLI